MIWRSHFWFRSRSDLDLWSISEWWSWSGSRSFFSRSSNALTVIVFPFPIPHQTCRLQKFPLQYGGTVIRKLQDFQKLQFSSAAWRSEIKVFFKNANASFILKGDVCVFQKYFSFWAPFHTWQSKFFKNLCFSYNSAPYCKGNFCNLHVWWGIGPKVENLSLKLWNKWPVFRNFYKRFF